MFDFELSETLKLKIRKLVKKDRKKAEIISKKIREIANSDAITIQHYKNLKREMKELKRVHIDTHFVLTFRVYLQHNYIVFTDFNHHDDAY
jgi:mRNA-degrading endonuclease RelE of RelBE toxin-antitoxin system